jgi:hypothetical protein
MIHEGKKGQNGTYGAWATFNMLSAESNIVKSKTQLMYLVPL